MVTPSDIRIEKSETRADAPRLTMSLAAFVLVCFFLPWVQVSCFGMQETASGVNLAREGARALWLAPIAMLLVLLVGLIYSLGKPIGGAFALVSMVGGALSAWLMFRERAKIGWGTGWISAQWTAWF